MDKYNLIDVAYGGLLHDIGKFYQRTYEKSNLSSRELETTKYNKIGNYYSHLHSGYTSRFLNKYLKMEDEFELLVSEHHKDEINDFLEIIKQADCIASSIDRKDEQLDDENHNQRGNFITARLHSVLSEVDFGKENKMDNVFPLSVLTKMNYLISNYKRKEIHESVNEYKTLFQQFAQEVENNLYLQRRRDFISYNFMYNLMNKYLVTIPASTYGGVKSTVSLFDHHKLTSAISSCLYDKECFEKKEFCMLEIDISGIQSFIYQVVEGSGTKQGLAKALRGRSALVALITNAVSYAFLNEFGLTVSNILFNTGGGSIILLPNNSMVKDKVEKVARLIRENLFKLFQADITFVNALIVLNKEELETFQSDKAIDLKGKLGRNKMQKFIDVINDDFFYEPINNNQKCKTCNRISKHEICAICKAVEGISDVYTKNTTFGIVYDFSGNLDVNHIHKIDLGFVKVLFVKNTKFVRAEQDSYYVDSINGFGFGSEKMIANEVPLKNNAILSFEGILGLTPKKYGDKKLAILKMDVDNLGGIFAFGLKYTEENRNQRSISKYVTMSRLIEFFFGHEIKNICHDVSIQVNENISNEVTNGTMFYINYAGGDDLVIIGSAYSIVKLSLEIYQRFAKFTGNENITISGGINFQNDKKPIRFGIQEAEEQLTMSKDGDKNAITLLNTTVSFKNYEQLLNDVFMMCKWLEENKVSRTMLYNIMSFINASNYNQFVYLIPRIQYMIFRLVKDQKVRKEILKQISEITVDSDVKQFILKLKLVMLFTRSN
ncbi:type III-A CRISPR-associated protein Cas10/Csm1 [Thomasclavelia cocleata]|uniref:type III-A CRISPR-associated protein Cas10/Csm1 n=1 Tax=Thomasclavelia cocleata TaxID=69824 RepID=UPI00242A7869|nr:type III-A CRISPR-associated protein Cas10/Csm1 [Thomasclavelia cocleata]